MCRHFDITFIYSYIILNLVRGGTDSLWASYRMGAYVVKNHNASPFNKTHRSLPFSGRSMLFEEDTFKMVRVKEKLAILSISSLLVP
jgi:hypothetical protein